MSTVPPPRQTLTIRANRETVVLLAGALAMTLAIGHAARNRPTPVAVAGAEQTAAGGWTGQLADLAQPASLATDVAPAPLSSDALTLPKAALALPMPPKPAAATLSTPAGAKPSKPAMAAAPVRRPPPSKPTTPKVEEANLAWRLNPLNHLPDSVKRPFAYAGEAMAGWVKRF